MIDSKNFATKMPIRSTKVELAFQDPLLHEAELPLSRRYYPLGYPLLLETNSREILQIADDSWGEFASHPQDQSKTPFVLALGVDGDSLAIPPEPVFRSRRHLYQSVSGPRDFAVNDFSTGYGFGWFTPGALEDREFFRYFFLDAMGYAAVAESYLASVHAACVAQNGRGVLLCGNPGAGKSSLAYACGRRGWTFISDDAGHFVRGSNSAEVRGNPFRLRFRPPAVELFPELAAFLEDSPRRRGDDSVNVKSARIPGLSRAAHTQAHVIVFLNRQANGTPRLTPFPRQQAIENLERVICFGRDESRQAQRECLRNLRALPAWELTYSALDPAIDCLESLVQP